MQFFFYENTNTQINKNTNTTSTVQPKEYLIPNNASKHNHFTRLAHK